MMRTFDWLVYAQHHESFRKQVVSVMEAGNDAELTCAEMFRMRFFGERQNVEIYPLSDDSPFSYKIIPMRMTYRVVLDVLNGNPESLNAEYIEK